MEKLNVLLVEDDPLARQLIEMFIEKSERYAFEGAITSALMTEAYLCKHKIDLILMDVCTAMNANGIDAAERVKKNFPCVKIIIITSQPEYSYITRARAVGVDSFWYKTVIQDEFITLLDKTMAGERIFPDTTPTLNIGTALSVEFTEKELEVLRLVVAGERDQDIAEELGVSINTVRTHLRVMMDKTGIRSRTALAVRVRDAGFVIVEPKEDEI
ncbi:MAG: response regulator transcription factor [Clostridia bacterium]|nr:response regulator transcription factor [Clostridia bacterium]